MMMWNSPLNAMRTASMWVSPIWQQAKSVRRCRFRGAIFDLDGTLLDSMHVWETIGSDYLASRVKVAVLVKGGHLVISSMMRRIFSMKMDRHTGSPPAASIPQIPTAPDQWSIRIALQGRKSLFPFVDLSSHLTDTFAKCFHICTFLLSLCRFW